jgi:hypothetical protein
MRAGEEDPPKCCTAIMASTRMGARSLDGRRGMSARTSNVNEYRLRSCSRVAGHCLVGDEIATFPLGEYILL